MTTANSCVKGPKTFSRFGSIRRAGSEQESKQPNASGRVNDSDKNITLKHEVPQCVRHFIRGLPCLILLQRFWAKL